MSGNAFVDQMDSAQDKIGLVTYDSNPNLRQTLSTNFPAVRTALKAMTPGSNTNERMGTYTGLQNIIATPADPTKVVQAVIVMTDGEYNRDGDMLARGTGTEIHLSEGSQRGNSLVCNSGCGHICSGQINRSPAEPVPVGSG